MRRPTALLGAVPAALAAWAMAVASAEVPRPDRPPSMLADYATRDIGLSADDLDAVELGRPVARSLATADANEVAIFAIIKVGLAKETYLQRLRDIAGLKQGDPVLQVGKFGSPPRLDDLDGLSLDPVDIDALKRCRVGDCHFALTTDAIARLGRDLDAASPDFAVQAARWVKQFLFELVLDYLERGDITLPVYTSRRRPVDVAGQFHALLAACPTFFGFPTPLKRYLREYPAGQPPNVESFVYWSKEQVGPKPVISLTHVVAVPDAERRSFISVASKQIYASHYFEASLGLTVAIDDADVGSVPGMYLVYVNRSRSDALGGFMGPLKRALVRARSRAGAEDALRRLKRSLETPGANSEFVGGRPRLEERLP